MTLKLEALRARLAPYRASVETRARVPERVRTEDEFPAVPARRPPRRTAAGAYCWSLESIRAARDAQMRGDFGPAVRLAKAMRTDDAAFIAYHNRIAPQNSIAAKLVSAGGARGDAVAKKAARSIIAPRATLAGIVGTLADHGIAIGHNDQDTNDEGTLVNMRLKEWPLEFVKWNSSREVLETQVMGGPSVDINHGDGEWIVFRKFDLDPWTQEACVLPGALVWAAHSYALRDWNATAKSHGQAKILGEMPEGFALATADGALTAEAQTLLDMLQDIAEGEAGAGLRQFGAKADFLSNGSNAWQVFEQLVTGREKAFARIYLGTDAILGSVGGAPGLDIAALFAIASSKVQGDFLALEEGLRTGLYEPWTAINEGDSSRAPSIKYEIPDPDEKKRSEDEGAKLERLHAEIKRRKENGMIVDQESVDALAALLGIRSAPKLANTGAVTVSIPLAPTDMARVVRVDEARGAIPLAPIGGEVGSLFLTELEEHQKAAAEAAKEKAKIAAQTQADLTTAEATAQPAPAVPA